MVKFSEKRNQNYLVVTGAQGVGIVWLTKLTEEAKAKLLGSKEILPGMVIQDKALDLPVEDKVEIDTDENGKQYPRYSLMVIKEEAPAKVK